MTDPPLEVGAVKAMLALALPAVAAPMVGAPGTVTSAKALTDKPANAEKLKAFKTFFKPNIGVFIAFSENYSANGLEITTCRKRIMFKPGPNHLE